MIYKYDINTSKDKVEITNKNQIIKYIIRIKKTKTKEVKF